MRMLIATVSTAAVLGALLGAPSARAAVNWASVPEKEIVLFYPGQSSWEWALSASEMTGSDEFRKGKDCAVCHIGEEAQMGPQIVTGQTRNFTPKDKPPYTRPGIEPTPIAGKPGAITAKVKVAHDASTLYVRLEFKEGQQPDAKQDPATATKVTVMFDDGKVPEANRGGCWAACHDDLKGMPSGGAGERTMYLPKSRAKLTRQGGGDALAPADQLAKLKSDGYQLEFWQAALNPGQPAKASSAIVFDKREVAATSVAAAEANQAGDGWVVVISRPLNAAAPYSPIAAGAKYHMAFAIHAGHTAQRFHYVSYERSLVLDAGDADLVAVKQ